MERILAADFAELTRPARLCGAQEGRSGYHPE
jgi:hypothetical protein